MLRLTQLDRAIRQEELQKRAPAELRRCCGTRPGQPHGTNCSEQPLGRHCQNGGDVCLAGNADGICCPEDSCDIDERVRLPPNVAIKRAPA
jgi:hypothetical protein